MATQAELDKKQNRTKSQSGTIGTVRRGGIYDLETQPSQNKQGEDERIANDGIDKVERIVEESSGGGLPEGYVETDVIICVDGSPVNGQFLFKEDTP